MSFEPSSRSAAAARSADPDPARAGRAAGAEASLAVGRARTRSVLAFASGRHGASACDVAAGIADVLPNATIVVVGGAGVVAPEGETEGVPAVSALALCTHVDVVAAPAADAQLDSPAALGKALGTALATDGRRRPTLFFCDPLAFSGELLDGFATMANASAIIGGATAPRMQIAVGRPAERAAVTSAIGVRLGSGVHMTVGVSPAVKLLTPWHSITEMQRGFVGSLDGRRALDVLTDSVRGRGDRPLVLVALAPAEGSDVRSGHVLVRAIAGVDPARGGVHLGQEPVRSGDRIAFATIDRAAARDDFASMLRDVARRVSGAAPVAAIYVSCAGRGKGLYGVPDVDARAIRERFGGLPFAGLHSSFEIAPFDGDPRVHLYTGVLGVLCEPS